MSSKVYQQGSSYMPRTDAGFRDWLHNASTLISEDPGRYGLSEGDADIIAGLDEQFTKLYTLCQSPAKRTTGLVTQKDAIRASAKGTMRVYAMQIKASEGVTDADKIQLGLNIGTATPTPVPAPASSPVLGIISAYSGEHVLRYYDENTPTSRAKPPGVTQLELFVAIGPNKATSYKQAEYAGVFTKQPITYRFEPEVAGQTATYYARWRTTRGLVGPFSLGTSMMIAFGTDDENAVPDGGQTGSGTTGTHSDQGGDDIKIAA